MTLRLKLKSVKCKAATLNIILAHDSHSMQSYYTATRESYFYESNSSLVFTQEHNNCTVHSYKQITFKE